MIGMRWTRYLLRVWLALFAGVMTQISASCDSGQIYLDIPGIVVVGGNDGCGRDCDDDEWWFGGGGWYDGGWWW